MATTWSSTGPRSVKAECTTGSESDPTLATEGMDLGEGSGFGPVGAFGIKVTADAGSTITNTTGLIRFLLWDDITGLWGQAVDLPDLLLTVSGKRQLAGAGYSITSPRGRIAAIPVGVTFTGAKLTINLNATTVAGQWV